MSEVKQGQDRFISVTSCADCPYNGNDEKCKSWRRLDKNQKLFLNLSNSVPIDFMLTDCPLDEKPTSQITKLQAENQQLKSDNAELVGFADKLNAMCWAFIESGEQPDKESLTEISKSILDKLSEQS